MKRSTDRLLTTHAGSLVRPREIVAIMRQVEAGQPYDAAALNRLLTPAVATVVRQQAEVGIDIPSDGEFGKRGWTAYVAERLGGLADYRAYAHTVIEALNHALVAPR
jgi:5-methyltetrahydropteroyltriglutamate--homocysteine methyltransferase